MALRWSIKKFGVSDSLTDGITPDGSTYLLEPFLFEATLLLFAHILKRCNVSRQSFREIVDDRQLHHPRSTEENEGGLLHFDIMCLF